MILLWLRLCILYAQSLQILVNAHELSLYNLQQINRRQMQPFPISPLSRLNCLLKERSNCQSFNRVQTLRANEQSNLQRTQSDISHREEDSLETQPPPSIPTPPPPSFPTPPRYPSLHRNPHIQRESWFANKYPPQYFRHHKAPVLNKNQSLHTPAHSHNIQKSEAKANAMKLKSKYYSTSTRQRVRSAVSAATRSASDMKSELIQQFLHHLDKFDQKFYNTTYSLLASVSPADRQENGISFVQSGFFLLLTLMTLSSEVDTLSKAEIQKCIGFQFPDVVATQIVKYFMTTLPVSSERLKFQRSARLMVWPGVPVSRRLRSAAAMLPLVVDKFTGAENTEQIVQTLNKKIEKDSGGAIHDTFDDSDIGDGGVSAVLMNVMYLRGRWRAPPTVLNGTHPFRDADEPPRTVRMIRINDLMNYALIPEWDAEALEIQYATPGLSLLMLVPREPSLRALSHWVTNTSLSYVTDRMTTLHMAAVLPLYTLRMTLLLPNKLQAMGISRLVDAQDNTTTSLRLSHGVQRIMFWGEPGRNAYKDDGIEWDVSPQFQMVVDRPYIFFVRWKNITLMNGNFVL